MAVDAVDVTKTYGALRAVDGVSIQVAQGEVYGVLGPNGAGKTTFLRMLFGLIAPDSGTIELFGRSWQRDGMRTLESVSGFIESPKFYPYLTGRENLVGMARLDGGAQAGKIDEVLQTVDLTGRDGDRVGGYSFSNSRVDSATGCPPRVAVRLAGSTSRSPARSATRPLPLPRRCRARSRASSSSTSKGLAR